jgi:gamma-glutamylputrescine oxidase
MTFSKKKTYEQHDNEEGSFYKNSVKPFEFSKRLENNLDIDLCVVGGGLTGISSALNLAREGYSVALCEARTLGWGASGRNGGQLGIGMRKDQFFIEKKFGFEQAKELWNLGLEAVSETTKLISKYNIQCALQKGVIHAGFSKRNMDDFHFEIDHMHKHYNYDGYKFFNKYEIKEEINSDIYNSGLLNNDNYHLNPLKLLLGLANELTKLKVRIYENTPITKILKDRDGLKVYSESKIIKAKKVIVCCNGYLDKLLGNIRNKFMPINNYMIATEPLGEDKAREIIKNNYAVSDTRFIIDYYRFSEDWRLLFGGGETFTSRFQHNSMKFVQQRMYRVFPMLKKYKIDYSWGGTLAITVNRLPSFGTLMDENIIYAHAYSGHGLALSTLAGKLISEKISGKSERFNFFNKIKHLSIPGGDIIRRPIYTSAIIFYKIKDFFNFN